MPELDSTFNKLKRDDVFKFTEGGETLYKVRDVYRKKISYEKLYGGGGDVQLKKISQTIPIKIQVS